MEYDHGDEIYDLNQPLDSQSVLDAHKELDDADLVRQGKKLPPITSPASRLLSQAKPSAGNMANAKSPSKWAAVRNRVSRGSFRENARSDSSSSVSSSGSGSMEDSGESSPGSSSNSSDGSDSDFHSSARERKKFRPRISKKLQKKFFKAKLVHVVSTRLRKDQSQVDDEESCDPFETATEVKAELETDKGVRVFLPLTDGGMNEWREVGLEGARRKGGALIQVIVLPGLSDMQMAEEAMARDRGVKVVRLDCRKVRFVAEARQLKRMRGWRVLKGIAKRAKSGHGIEVSLTREELEKEQVALKNKVLQMEAKLEDLEDELDACDEEAEEKVRELEEELDRRDDELDQLVTEMDANEQAVKMGATRVGANWAKARAAVNVSCAGPSRAIPRAPPCMGGTGSTRSRAPPRPPRPPPPTNPRAPPKIPSRSGGNRVVPVRPAMSAPPPPPRISKRPPPKLNKKIAPSPLQTVVGTPVLP